MNDSRSEIRRSHLPACSMGPVDAEKNSRVVLANGAAQSPLQQQTRKRLRYLSAAILPPLLLSLAGCASSPSPNVALKGAPSAASPLIQEASSKPVPVTDLQSNLATGPHREDAAIFQKLWLAQNRNVINKQLLLDLDQIRVSFVIEREAVQEFDQILAASQGADFLKKANHLKLNARIQGSNIYRTIAENRLLASVIFLESLAPTDPVAAVTLAWLGAQLKSDGQRTQVARSDELAMLALVPFAERLLTETGLTDSTRLLSSALPLSGLQLQAIERSSDLQREIKIEGLHSLQLADHDLKNWIQHFSKNDDDPGAVYAHASDLVGRKHSFGGHADRNRAPAGVGASPSGSAAALRPLTARSLNDNEFAFIFEGKTHRVYTPLLASTLITLARPATFFVADQALLNLEGQNSKVPGRTSPPPSGAGDFVRSTSWAGELSQQKFVAFGAEGRAFVPMSLESDIDLASSIDRAWQSLQRLHLPKVGLVDPSFDGESSRVGKIAKERGLRLVRANIESFDEIDFDAQHVAQRIARQTTVLKSGIIRLQLGTPRAAEIQTELTHEYSSRFPASNSGPRFVALLRPSDAEHVDRR